MGAFSLPQAGGIYGTDSTSRGNRWLKDKFGLSWQIVPTILSDLLADDDDERSGRVLAAMLQMGQLDIGRLTAAAGAPPTD